MRRALVAALTLLATPALAHEEARFNLDCREFEDRETLATHIDHQFSVDLDAMSVCRRGNPRCAEVVRQGRFLEFSYRFQDGDQAMEVFRLYDPETGSLTQIMRRVGDPGRSYGDAVCEVRPFASVTD
ncbi:hypothetical protein [Brevundimonas aveniformis]|uniref:hypothetical protein n=1 Tax=Brevundimonas aveniformis TaxID=370977 RepID=UPI00040CAD11|nr:hypothetical protein [Brevundimonas aveniformis]